ncbi:carboxypeptidase-like regulatory domain-containing protein [Caballeronia sp. GAWG1-5s-s]|uniref:carboxypeptidase-like regulatory domain-containing protein n=1 Tax=Caballeronia sp. GAWG1-5s-s TaxID=2921743 RepID=UPI002027CD8B|nr:carboxypeptidase-like regulatory domain-containing protein [Caballeronia sp. GAWG1-5s-s]
MANSGAVSIALKGAPAISPSHTAVLVNAADGVSTFQTDATSFFSYDANANSLVMSASNASKLFAAVPIGLLSLDVTVSDDSYSFTRAYNILFSKATAVLKGSIVNDAGSPATNYSGRYVDIVGYASKIRRVATVSASGTFEVGPLPPGTYEVSIVDLASPKVVIGTAVLSPTDTAVQFTLTAPSAAAAAGAKAIQRSQAHSSGNGAALPSRSVDGGASAAAHNTVVAGCGSANGVFSVSSSAQNDTQECPISYTVPQGTSQVAVDVTVSSTEYPVYTANPANPFNDTYSYSILNLPSTVIQGANAVNNTHRTTGVVKKHQCVDVTAATKGAPLTITGSITSTNVGDSALPTTVAVNIALTCGGISVTDAQFKSPNTKGFNIIAPKNIGGNIDGRYVSTPIAAAQNAWGMPITIKYSPATASISKIAIAAVRDGATVQLGDVAGQATISAGQISIPNWIVSPLNLAVSASQVQFTVTLTGQVDGKDSTSDPATISFKGADYFVPLFLANETPQLAARRTNGLRDVGGDSWATSATIAWLLGKPYRFDDISGLHIAQNGTRSALGHAGHSDGAQIDMRYSDGSGGYSDGMGGQGSGAQIRAAAMAARVENPPGPKLALISKWIKDNRTMIENESPTARSIYFGKDWMAKLLVNGAFEDGTPVGTVGTWKTKPGNASPQDSHLDHWHISLKVAHG